jgi:tetratricopeptide (TPR) repeat protein
MLRAYLESANYSKALNLLDTVKVNFSQEDISYLYNLVGNFLLDSNVNNLKEIIPQYLKKIDNSFYFDWRINMISGYLSDRINDTASVTVYFNKSLSSDTLPDIPLAVAVFYSNKKEKERALNVLNKYEVKYPDNFNFPFYKGLIYTELDSNRLALNEYFQAFHIDTTNLDVLGQIGLLYDRLKIYDSCDYAYEKVLTIEPDNPLINNNFAYSLSVRGAELEKALEMSTKAIGQEPDNPSYLDTYGWIQYNIGNFEIALDYILKAMKAGDASAEVYEHLGYIYLKLEKKEEAYNAWKKSLELNPDNDIIKEKMKILTN